VNLKKKISSELRIELPKLFSQELIDPPVFILEG